jgi:hypothetical protein
MRRYRQRKVAAIVRVNFEIVPDGASLLVALGWLHAGRGTPRLPFGERSNDS